MKNYVIYRTIELQQGKLVLCIKKKQNKKKTATPYSLPETK